MLKLTEKEIPGHLIACYMRQAETADQFVLVDPQPGVIERVNAFMRDVMHHPARLRIVKTTLNVPGMDPLVFVHDNEGGTLDG